MATLPQHAEVGASSVKDDMNARHFVPGAIPTPSFIVYSPCANVIAARGNAAGVAVV
jgi:hypothetical protein